jgi:hypothetical protein
MGEGSAELPHLANRMFEAAERVVERGGDVLEFVLDAACRHAPLECAHIDLARVGGEHGQGPQRESREPP